MIFFTKKVFYSKKIFNIITLDLYSRSKNRIKIILKDGREAVIMLKNLIRGGDIITDDSQKEFIKIISAKEKLSEICCDNKFLLLKACYHLGNRHVLLEIQEKKLIYYFDHVIDNMIINFGLKVNHILAPFEPEDGAYSNKHTR